MKKILLIATLSVVLPSMAYSQAESEITCKSVVSPTNVKVFEGNECPFGWVAAEDTAE